MTPGLENRIERLGGMRVRDVTLTMALEIWDGRLILKSRCVVGELGECHVMRESAATFVVGSPDRLM